MSLVLRNATLEDGRAADVHLEGGTITAITPSPARDAARVSPVDLGPVLAGALGPQVPSELDLDGALLLPALVNGHAHLDKTLLGGPWVPHSPGSSVRDRVLAEQSLRERLDDPVSSRGAVLAQQMVDFGTGTVRSHVDIDPVQGLDGLHEVLALRETFRDLLRLQVVAFPQGGIVTAPGVADLLEESLRAGAEIIGGLDPLGFDGDISGHLDVVFGLAEKHGAGIDIHLHDLGEEAVRQYEEISVRTRRAGLSGRVTLSHAYGLGSISRDEVRRVGALLAEAGIAVLTNGPAGPMPPVLDLRAEGVTVFTGSDNIRDAWWPYGDGDMLAVVRQVAYQSDFRRDEDLQIALELATSAASTALGLEGGTVAVGARADLLILDCATVAEAVAAHPTGRLVLHQGRPVAGSLQTTLHPSPTGHDPAPAPAVTGGFR